MHAEDGHRFNIFQLKNPGIYIVQKFREHCVLWYISGSALSTQLLNSELTLNSCKHGNLSMVYSGLADGESMFKYSCYTSEKEVKRNNWSKILAKHKFIN